MKKNNKIGILTFKRTANYGAQFQNYALQSYIKNQNIDVLTLDYINKRIDELERPQSFVKQKNLKMLIKYFKCHKYHLRKWKKFEDFRKKYIKLSKEYNINNVNALNTDFDLIIVGSDQVWNTDITNNDYNIEEKIKSTKKKEKKIFNFKNLEKNTKTQNLIMYEQLSNSSAYAIKSNLYICLDKMRGKYFFETGLFTHIVYYDKYMSNRYPNGYVRINYADAGSIFLRVFSECGIIGLILFILSIFIAQAMRLGEYNWILNCLSFVIILNKIELPSKFYKCLSLGK